MVAVVEELAIEEVVRDVAESHGLAEGLVTAHLPSVPADRTVLSQVFDRLLRGIAPGAPGTPARVVVTGHRRHGVVTVELSSLTGAPAPAGLRGGSSHAARLIERHGGTFEVGEGPGGTGCTFRFTLPAGAAPRSRDGAGAALRRQHVEVA